MEENTTATNETQVNETSNEEMEALREELAKAQAETARFKASVDKLTKEAAEKKREERAKMSEEEKRKADQEEEYNRLKEKAEADAKELNHLRAITAYKEIDDADTIEKLIDAIADVDHPAIMKIIADIKDKAIKEKEAEWKKSRPAGFVGSGSYPSKTKEEIMAITDPVERQKAIAANLELFN